MRPKGYAVCHRQIGKRRRSYARVGRTIQDALYNELTSVRTIAFVAAHETRAATGVLLGEAFRRQADNSGNENSNLIIDGSNSIFATSR
jgi:hypothetical protein